MTHPHKKHHDLTDRQARDLRVQTSALLYLADAKAREERARWWASLTPAQQAAHRARRDAEAKATTASNGAFFLAAPVGILGVVGLAIHPVIGIVLLAAALAIVLLKSQPRGELHPDSPQAKAARQRPAATEARSTWAPGEREGLVEKPWTS